MKKFINCLNLSLIIGLTTLTSCTTSAGNISTGSLVLSDQYVEIVGENSVTVSVTSDFDLKFEAEDADLVDLSINDKSCNIRGKNKSGATRIKVSSAGNESVYKYIFVKVSKNSNVISSKLVIKNSAELVFPKNSPIDLDTVEVNLVVTESSGAESSFDLTRSEYYFNIEDGHIFTDEDSFLLKVYSKDDDVECAEVEVPIVENILEHVKYLFSKLATNSYNFSFNGLYNGVQSLEGVLTFNEKYFLNSYSEMYFAKDSNGVFKFDVVTDSSTKKEVISTKNGYFYEGNDASLYDAVSLYCGINGLSNVDVDAFDAGTINEDILTVTNASFLTAFWNKTLGFNGTAKYVDFSVNDGGLTYFVSGTLSSGISMNFTGSIYDIGSATNDLIEEFILDKNHVVNKTGVSEAISLINSIKSNSYTIKLSSSDVHVTDKYIANVDSSGTTSGYIEVNSKVYNFTLEDDEVVLGTESSLSSIQDSAYDLGSYGAFDDEKIYKFYDATYYGCYMSFDSKDALEFNSLFKLDTSKYTPFGVGVEEDDDGLININYFVKYSSGITYTYLSLTDVGLSNIEAIDTYLSSLA